MTSWRYHAAEKPGLEGGQSPPQAFAESLLRLLFCGQKSGRILGGQARHNFAGAKPDAEQCSQKESDRIQRGTKSPAGFRRKPFEVIILRAKIRQDFGRAGPASFAEAKPDAEQCSQKESDRIRRGTESPAGFHRKPFEVIIPSLPAKVTSKQ